MGLAAAAFFAFSGILTRLAAQRIGAISGTFISIAPAFVLAMTLALILDMSDFGDITVVGLLWLALVALFQYPLGRGFNIACVSRIGAARGANLHSSAPIWASLLAIIFLGERPNVLIILGTIAVVAGVILIMGERTFNASRSNQSQQE